MSNNNLLDDMGDPIINHPPESSEEAVVTYPVRELLSQIRNEQTTGFARLEASLITKADKADVARLEIRLDQHGTRLSTLETWQHEEKVSENVLTEREEKTLRFQHRIFAALGTILMITATLASAYLGIHLHF